MELKETVMDQKRELESGKKPYETASFLILVILLGYQWITMINMFLYKWANNFAFFNTGFTNMPGFVVRIFNMAGTTGAAFWGYIAFLVYLGYLTLVFVFVWWYCKKKGHAKWTWTLIVLFSPNIFLVSPYVIYAAYAFRVYLYRFLKAIVVDFKKYDYKKDMEEVESAEQDYENLREERQQEKEEKARQKAEKKATEKEEKDAEKEEKEAEK